VYNVDLTIPDSMEKSFNN
ncbi:vacuolar ATP synthase subunit g, putative, partial [Plasmodium reichenowi]